MNSNAVIGLVLAFVVFAARTPGLWGAKFTDESAVPQTGTVGKPFRHQLNGQLAAGLPPFVVTKLSGQLPPGLTMSKRGLILGRPTTPGVYKFWGDIADEKDCPPHKHSQREFTITIDPPWTTESLPSPDNWEKPGWTLTYGEEFTSMPLDESHWAPAYQGTMPAKFVIVNSALHILMDRDVPPMQDMPPSRPDKLGRVSSIETQERFMQQYGFFEVRARMPGGSGTMAAIWLSPGLAYEKLKSDGGHRQSENEAIDIDIFRHEGKEPKTGIFAAHHGRTSGNATDRREVKFPFAASSDFHVYGLEWNEKTLVWYVDGKEVHRSDKVPHTPMFVRLSLFEDEAAYGASDQSVPHPKVLEVDYVRVYERASEAANP